MGFYGNITNTSNTTFQFDRIYPNRLNMDANANNDGIFIGRYVLVEYQEDAAYPVALGRKETNTIGKYYLYTSTETEEQTVIKYLGDVNSSTPGESDLDNKDNKDGVYEKEIIQYTDPEDNSIKFYICQNSDEGSVVNGPAIFKETVLSTASQYIQNFNIDETHYGQGSNGFKGYDSTVWTKVSDTSSGQLITKYVNIADLNSVVPTFAITADAPTMKPITPHFDSDSTNVYYELHAQPQWGFRVAQADGTNSKSDTTTQWKTAEYDPTTDKKSTKYGSGVNRDGITEWSETPTDIEAAIYYNAAGFKKQLVGTDERQGSIKKHDDAIQDVIKIMPTGKSGATYEAHDGTKNKTPQEDIQELTIQLPSIGNMMSDAWDIIHGKQRNDYRGDGENASLQGKLDSFDAFYDNQIPVKRTNDGKIVGSRINGAANYDNNNTWAQEVKPKEVLYDDSNPNFNRDDAWIKTEVYTTNLKDGDKNTANDQARNSGISIHHTFHATADSTSSVDKNIENGNIKTDSAYKSDKIQSNNLLNIDDKKDFIELYTPYVDAKGHVVGKNIETITLPYGYKTFTTNGLGKDENGKEIINDLHTTIIPDTNGANTSSSSATATQTVASNTQDSMAIEPYNKWIQTQLSDDKLVIAHEIHAINTEKDTTDLNDLKDNKIQNEINIPDWDYDKAGHIKKKGEHTYTLPFGYKIVKAKEQSVAITNPNTNTNEVIADSTQDTLQFASSNKWIRMSGSNSGTGVNYDTFNIGHEVHSIDETASDQGDIINNIKTSHTNLNSDDKGNETEKNLTIYDWGYDAAGHITEKRAHTYTLPYGYKTIKVVNNSNGVAAPLSTVVETGQSADQTQDTLNLNASNKWIVLDNAEDDTIKFGHKISDLPKGWHSSSDTTIGEFGESFKVLKYETDEAGHVIDSGEDVITIPQGSYSAATEVSGSKEIITSIGFTPSSGAITSTKANTDTLSLSNYSANTNEYSKLVDIVDTDTINNAFKKIQNHINGLNLNVNEVTDDTKIITGIVQKNGQVSLSRSTAGNLQIGAPSNDGTIPANSSLNNAFNIINNRIKIEEDALAKEVQDRKDAITNAIAGIFDKNDDNEINKLAEIIEWINNNPSTATEMQAAIQDNAKAISDETALARSEEGKIAAALATETGRATAAEQANTTAIGNEKTRAESIEQGLQNQINTLGGKVDNKLDSSIYEAKIEELQLTIDNLYGLIEDLEKRIIVLEPQEQPEVSEGNGEE